MIQFAEIDTLKKKPRHLLRRFEDNSGNRFYYWKEKNKVQIAAGITTVLSAVMPESKFLTEWKIKSGPNWKQLLKSTADYGSMMHVLYLEWTKNKWIKKTDYQSTLEKMEMFCIANGLSPEMAGKDLLAFIKFCEDYNIKPLLCEVMLVGEPVFGSYYAMTGDFICELDIVSKEQVSGGFITRGKNKGKEKFTTKKIVKRGVGAFDFKSNYFSKDSKSFYDAHKFQLYGIKKALKYNFDINTDIIANFAPNNWRTDPTYSLHEHIIDEKTDWEFNHYLELASKKGLFRPHGKKLIFDNFATSKGYRYLFYDELVKNKLI